MTKAQYLEAVGPDGAMFVGDPEHVSQKIIRMMEELGINRFMLHLPVGSMPHTAVLRAIRLFGERVAPRVRDYFKQKEL